MSEDELFRSSYGRGENSGDAFLGTGTPRFNAGQKASLRREPSICFAIFFFVSSGLYAQTIGGQTRYRSEQNCIGANKLTQEQCANASANAQAEFEEKAPRFPTRESCEKIFAESGCGIGFKGADGWAGKKSGVYFSPRQQGFLVMTTAKGAFAAPFTSGPNIRFSFREISKRNVAIDTVLGQRARESWRAEPARPSGGTTPNERGLSEAPMGDRAAVPPPTPVDPNFDCSSVLEPSKDGRADIGCYPAPTRRR